MSSKKAEIAEVLKDIGFHKQVIRVLVDSGRAMTDPLVLEASKRLDTCLNHLYRLYGTKQPVGLGEAGRGMPGSEAR